MKRRLAAAVLLLALAACATKQDPTQVLPEYRVNEAAFRTDEIYGVRHMASGAVCPGLIAQVPRIRATIVSDDGPRYDWCQYLAKNVPVTFDVRIENIPNETPETGLAALKALRVKDPGYAETKADFPDRQTFGFTYAKAGDTSHGVWLTRAGVWRVSITADYPEARRAEVLTAIDDFFRKQRAR